MHPLLATTAHRGCQPDGRFTIAVAQRIDGLQSPGPLGSGVGAAWHVICAMETNRGLWVIHALQRQSKSGIKTPKAEIDLIRGRLSCLKRELLK